MQQQIIILDLKKKGKIPDEGTPPLSVGSSDLCLQPACCQGGGCETVSIWKSRLLFACCCVHGLVCICVFGIKNHFLRSAQTGALRAPTRRESVNRGFRCRNNSSLFSFLFFYLGVLKSSECKSLHFPLWFAPSAAVLPRPACAPVICVLPPKLGTVLLVHDITIEIRG